MDNKEERALSPAVPTLTHIHQSACQPSSQQAVSQTAGAPHGRKRFQPICFLHVSPLMAPFIKMARSQSALSPRRIYRLAACVPSQKQTHSSPPAHMLSQKGFAHGPAHLGGSYSSLRGFGWTKLGTRVQIVSVVHAGKQQRTCDVLIA